MRDYELNALIEAGTKYFTASAEMMKRVEKTLKNVSLLGATMLAHEIATPEYPERPESPERFYDSKPNKPFDTDDKDAMKEYEDNLVEYEKAKAANNTKWEKHKEDLEKYKEDMEKYRMYKKETDILVKTELIKVLESLNK